MKAAVLSANSGMLGNRLPAHHRAGEVLRQPVLVAEGPGGGVDIDHWHARTFASMRVRHRMAMRCLRAHPAGPLGEEIA